MKDNKLYHSSFLKNNKGNISILFALLAPVLILMLGGMLDWTLANHSKSKIQHATDMAILASLKTFTDKKIPQKERLAKATQTAKNMMKANLAGSGITLDNFNISIKKNNENHEVAVVDWRVKVPTNFLKIVGVDDLEVKDHVEAKLGISTSKYVDLYIMIDFSSSMGIPATVNGIRRLKAATGCEFACHAASSGNITARAQGIDLRMDVVKKAVRSISKKIKKLKTNNDKQYRIGLYGFNTRGFTILEPSANMRKVREAIDSYDVTSSTTNLDRGIDYLNTQLGEQGEGTSDDDRIKMGVFLSDGFGGHGGGIDTVGGADCNAITNKDIKLMVVYTTYEAVNHSIYKKQIGPIKPKIANDMKNCASKDTFYQTRDVKDIKKAFDKIFVEFTVAKTMALTK